MKEEVSAVSEGVIINSLQGENVVVLDLNRRSQLRWQILAE